MGLDSRACTALAARAAEKGVAVAVSHNFLFSPAYERLRSAIKADELGRIDHIDVSWHFGLPILQFGPFDNWMFAAPANLLFEIGPHLAAFVVDLLGLPEIRERWPNPVELPGDQRVFRHWNATARSGATSVALSISLTAGQGDRILRVRGRGGSAQLDFGRSIVWRETTGSDNPIFEAHGIADALASQARRQARQGVVASLERRACETTRCQSVRGEPLPQHPRFLCQRAEEARCTPRSSSGYQRHTAVRVCCRCSWRWNAESRQCAGGGRRFGPQADSADRRRWRVHRAPARACAPRARSWSSRADAQSACGGPGVRRLGG